MKKSGHLLKNLKENASHIEVVRKKIQEFDNKPELTEDENRALESLYRKEFSLHMDNSSIYDDLIEEIQGEDDFTKKYIKQQAQKFLKVSQVDV